MTFQRIKIVLKRKTAGGWTFLFVEALVLPVVGCQLCYSHVARFKAHFTVSLTPCVEVPSNNLVNAEVLGQFYTGL